MGRNKKNHEPIDDTFENVVDAILEVPVENKRVRVKSVPNKNNDNKNQHDKEK